jgi:hypothetical protein
MPPTGSTTRTSIVRLLGVAAVVAFCTPLGGCALSPTHQVAAAREIPAVKPVAPQAVWREWVQETVDCLHRAPSVPFDSVEWFVAPRGIPNAVAPAEPGHDHQCWSGMSYLADRKVVLSPWCSGDTKGTVVHEALHVMYDSPSVLLNTREWWHDPKVFSRRCGVSA